MSANRFLWIAWIATSFGLAVDATPRSSNGFDSSSLTAPENFVFSQITAGKTADLKERFGGTNSVLRGAFLEFLLTEKGTNIHRNGFSIKHAEVREPLDLHNAEVPYEFNLLECRFQGKVNLAKSSFENGLSFAGSTFAAPVNLTASKIGRLANFDKTKFAAALDASQMQVAGVLSWREAEFSSPTGRVDFTSLKVSGDAFFNGSKFAGPVLFCFASVAENCRFDGCVFSNPSALADFEAMKVGATTGFPKSAFAGYISLKDTRFSSLDLGGIKWPQPKSNVPWLWLNGMTCERISAGSEKDSCKNLYELVLRASRGSAYSADIFNNLEKYYRKLGYPRQADEFFRASKQREREEVLSGLSWVWSYFLEKFVGYGRSPERALFWSSAIITIGFIVFRPNRMEPQRAEYEGRKYSPFWYSVDVYLPIIKLHDAEIWKPKEEYFLTHVWRRIHTILGWALIPIALAAWTGMLSH